MKRRLLLVLVRGVWLSSFVLIFALGALRSGIGEAQETDTTVADTTSTTSDLPYAVLGEELSGPPPSDEGPRTPSIPLPFNSPPILVGWIDSAVDSWYRMPLWSQAAVASAAIATLAIGLASLFRGLAEAFLEGRRGH